MSSQGGPASALPGGFLLGKELYFTPGGYSLGEQPILQGGFSLGDKLYYLGAHLLRVRQ